MQSTRRHYTRQAKTKAQKEINRIFEEDSIDDEEYYNAINVRSAVKPTSQPSKITLKECKALYKKYGIKALFPFEITKKTIIWVIYDILNVIERIHKNRPLFGYGYRELTKEQQKVAEIFYNLFDNRALSYIYGMIDDTQSYFEDLI